MIGVYMILNKAENKVYIGQSRRLKDRFGRHKRSLENKTHHNKELQKDFDKYGKENFEFIVLQECTVDKLHELEEYFILCFDSANPLFGYNLTYGGECDRKTERCKKLMPGNHHPMPPELKERLRLVATGKTPWNKGKKASAETRQKQSLAKLGKPAHNRKSVLCVNTGEIFESSVKAGKAHNTEPTNIRKCCRNERPLAGGMMWKYL